MINFGKNTNPLRAELWQHLIARAAIKIRAPYQFLEPRILSLSALALLAV